MKIRIENLEKIKKLEIEIPGITVIELQEDYDVSILKKAIMSVYKGLVKYKTLIPEIRKEYVFYTLEKKIYSILRMKSSKLFSVQIRKITDECIKRHKEGTLTEDIFTKRLLNINKIQNWIGFILFIPFLYEDLIDSIDVEDKIIVKEIIQRQANLQFIENRLQNSLEESYIYLANKKGEVGVTLKNWKVINIENPIEMENSPIDLCDFSTIKLLLNIIQFEKETNKPVEGEVLNKIYEMVSELAPGKLKQILDYITYVEEGEERSLHALSNDAKLALCFKMLLEKGALRKEAFLIFDESKISLAASWKKCLAKIFSILQKELNMNILIIAKDN